MGYLFLAVKRALRSVYFPILLILCAVISASAPSLGKSEALRPAGICNLDNSNESELLTASLLDEGFIIEANEAVLRKKISLGELDCGIIIKAGFVDRLTNVEPDKSIIFITSPLSFAQELYKNHVSAAIFNLAAPIITARELGNDTLSKYGITINDIVTKYRDDIDKGPLFSFDVQAIHSDRDYKTARADTYLKFFSALIIFSAVMYSICDIAKKDLPSLLPRLGKKTVFLASVLPNLAVRLFGILLSLAAAALLEPLFGTHSLVSMLPFLAAYTLFTFTFALIAAAIFRNSTPLRTLTFIFILFSLVFCPAYVDLAAFSKAFAVIRSFLPTYLLWHCTDRPAISLLIPLLMPAAAYLYYLRMKPTEE